ncbi:hypothetical protein Tco_0947099 [Tanacetum coccineum]
MLDRTDFVSWKQRIRLYCQGKEKGVNILKSIDEGPFQMGTIRDTIAEGTEGSAGYGELRTELEMQIQVKQDRLSENGVALDDEQLLFIAGGQDNVVDEVVDDQPVQDLALNVDNVFQVDDCDAFDFDVDEAPTAQTIFMANLSSTDPIYDEASPSYDSDILSEVPAHDNYQDAVCEHHEVHEMHDDVQPNYVVDSHADYTSDSNMILYDQYVKDNVVPVVQIDNSLIAELETYKEHVKLYERRAKFELTEREQKINEQLRIVIADRNLKEENLKRELHSVKLQLTSTINHNKLMIAEVTRKKMNDKMKDPECVKKKVKIAPHDYSKENYLATFTPQKQLTPEQIFWSNDLIKMKAEALKGQTTTSRPIKALTVYPPNTPTTLRITPTGLTEGERGFEQTKECYLTEVIPFFKTLKNHFEGIQKALTKEIKEMKEVFEELEAEVDQNVVNRKHDEIERKNLLIANDNLIADCLSKEVFYIATNSELTVSRFTKMHDAHTVVQARCLTLEAELSKLKDKIQKDDHNELVKYFSNLEITQLIGKVTVLQEQNELFRTENAKIKQHYKELYDSIKITHAKHIEQTTALLTENENVKAQIHENMKCITMDSVKPRVLVTGRYAIDVEPIPPRNRNNREVYLDYLKHLKESVETLREIVEEAKVDRPLDSSLAFACLYTKHSQELLEYVIGTCPKD